MLRNNPELAGNGNVESAVTTSFFLFPGPGTESRFSVTELVRNFRKVARV